MSQYPVAIVGAGPAGISVALSLKDRGVQPLLIDRAEHVAASWRNRYDRLKLNTGRKYSHLPGRPYPAGTPLFPHRDEVVAHFERHAHEGGIDLRLGTTVERVDRGGQERSDPGNRFSSARWRLTTAHGDIDARIVVIATGYEHTPVIPDWPGSFDGELIHSSGYRNPKPFAGKRVLVVGSGSSGMEIAHDLATGGAEKVWLAVRTPPNIMPRMGPANLSGDVIAVPLYHLPPRIADRISTAARLRTFGDLADVGLPVPAEGPFSRAHRLRVAPTLVDPEVIDAVRTGAVQVVSGVAALDGDSVGLADGGRVEPDVVISATGYRRGLEPVVGHLDVLTPEGVPKAIGATPAAGGLYFHGLVSRPGLIRYVGRTSRGVAKKIAGELLTA